MRIAMIGHKEFPSRVGGVEVVVYELATRLTARGVDVTVYNRGKEKHHNRYKELGVNVVRSFTPKNKSLNAMLYSFVATFHALFRKYDIIHYHAIGPCVPLVIAHIFGRKTVATIHGLNWKVDKWGSFASKYLRLGEKIAAKYADTVITLSEGMRQYFLNTYDRDTVLRYRKRRTILYVKNTDLKKARMSCISVVCRPKREYRISFRHTGSRGLQKNWLSPVKRQTALSLTT